MKKFTLRFFVSIITFFLGISAVAIWVFNNQSVNQNPDSPLSSTYVFKHITACGDYSLTSKAIEEYAVYSAALANQRYSNKIVIRSKTIDGGFLADPESISNLLSDSEDVISNYKRKNEDEHSLENNFDVNGKVIFITEREIEKIFNKDGDGWTKFYKKYPDANGIITFSRVGINAERTEALVYVSNSCGGECGAGVFIHLQKENGKWVIKQEIQLWVS